MSSRLHWAEGVACSPFSAYLERQDEDLPWHDQAADLLYDRIWRPLWARARDPAHKLRGMLTMAAQHDASYRSASDTELQACAGTLKATLRRNGLKDEVLAQTLALAREVAARTLGMRPHDVQMMGACSLLHGCLTEMATGEGKTLTAALAVATAALAGIPVHVVTVNDYLAERDAEIMAPMYRFLALRVSTVVNATPAESRRAAYQCDITYCTNKELAFDYLKDRVALARSGGRMQMALDSLNTPGCHAPPLLLRGLHFAIVDEADSIFIDEARTPLILSASVPGDEEASMVQSAMVFARQLDRDADYLVHERERRIELTPAGRGRIAGFVHEMAGVWASSRARCEVIEQALSALHLFERDQQYVVLDGKVQIVDEFTGRILADRSWENGLHQMIEAKEGCPLSDRRVTLARITYQRLFKRYVRLAGMTGTGREVAGEIWSTFGLRTMAIPPHRPSLRHNMPGRLYRTAPDKWQAVAQRVRELAVEQGRPVLVGTRSVEASEQLSGLLHAAGVPHVLLNAKQDKDEAQAIAAAGSTGRVTVATNLAGRGTDIRLGPGAAERGGLHVILTECHASARVDRQLIGRGARQGDPGSAEMMVSLEDEVLRVYAGPLTDLLRPRLSSSGQVSHRLLALLRFWAQGRAQRKDAQVRRAVMKMDKHVDQTLAFSGVQE
jgi:preprotein translocase subunit SecA